VTLLEAARRKCEFLRSFESELANIHVVWGRAEEQAPETFGVAVAKALAQPPVAAELCLPLVRPGGAVVLWAGPTAEPDRVAAVAERLAARLEASPVGFLVLRKTGPTPAGFPRRPGMAKKRPLA
jgi:16S rRNA (guanine527-N7)-methyltransferase